MLNEARKYDNVTLAVAGILGQLSAVSYRRSRELNLTELVQKCDPKSKAIALGQLVCSLCQLKGAGCTGLQEDKVTKNFFCMLGCIIQSKILVFSSMLLRHLEKMSDSKNINST